MYSARRTGPHGRFVASLATLFGLVLSCVGLAVASAQTARQVEWSVAPANNDLGEGRSSFRYQVQPGTTFDDELIIRNYSDITLDLSVFALDGVVTDAGTLGLPPTGTPSTQVGAWVVPETASVSIPAGGEQGVKFHVSVPADAAPGDYIGGLVTARTASGAHEVNVESRLASRIVVGVPGETRVENRIANVSVVDVDTAWIPFAPVRGTLRYEVTNSGNTLSRTNLNNTITLGAVHEYGPSVNGQGEVVQSVELMPGGSGTLEQEVVIWPLFLHRAKVELTPESLGGELGETVSASVTVWVIPWGSLAALIVIGVGIFGALRVRKANKEREALLAARKAELMGEEASIPNVEVHDD